MTIKEVTPAKVFTTLTAGVEVYAIDFKKKQMTECSGQLIRAIQTLITGGNNGTVKFYTVEEGATE